MKHFHHNLLVNISLLLTVSGCASSMVIPSSEVVDSAGKVVTKTAGTVGDTSAYRTKQKYDTWQRAYISYAKEYQSSGFQMEFQEVVLSDGTKAFLPKRITFRERPDFIEPAELRDHPVWASIDNAVKVITPWGFGAWAANSIVGSIEEIAGQPGTIYNGPVQMSGSYNSNSTGIPSATLTPVQTTTSNITTDSSNSNNVLPFK